MTVSITGHEAYGVVPEQNAMRFGHQSGDREEYVKEGISHDRHQLTALGGVFSNIPIVGLVDFTSPREQAPASCCETSRAESSKRREQVP